MGCLLVFIHSGDTVFIRFKKVNFCAFMGYFLLLISFFVNFIKLNNFFCCNYQASPPPEIVFIKHPTSKHLVCDYPTANNILEKKCGVQRLFSCFECIFTNCFHKKVNSLYVSTPFTAQPANPNCLG